MAVDFEHRAPRPGDEIGIGTIDLQEGDAWRPLGTTTAWCWQQGCMLQWLPGSASEVIWNERAGDRYVACITDTATGASRTVPAPVYALSPDGRSAVGPDFRRLNDMRPGYGYEGIPDPYADQLAPEESGIHTVDLSCLPFIVHARVHGHELTDSSIPQDAPAIAARSDHSSEITIRIVEWLKDQGLWD